MRDESLAPDLKQMWQNQPAKASTMTLEKIREKTQALHARTRRDLIRSGAGPLTVAAICAFGLRSPDPLFRTAFTLAILWSLIGLYFVNRGMWSGSTHWDTAFEAGLPAYRIEIERRRAIFGRSLLWSFGPIILALAALTALLFRLGIMNRELPVGQTALKMAPFLTLAFIWLMGVFVMRVRNQRDLQREIKDLNALERADS